MLEQRAPTNINISSLTIAKIVLLGLALIVFWLIRDVVVMIFVAWVLSMTLQPWVNFVQRFHIPRFVGILSVYILAVSIVCGFFIVLVPAVTTELTSIAQNFPSYYEPIQAALNQIRHTGETIGLVDTLQTTLNNAVKSVAQLPSGIYSAVASVLNGLVAVLAVLVIAFYMTSEENAIKNFIQSIVPINYQPYVAHKFNQIQQRLSNWLWGELVLMIFVGTLTGLALWLLGVKYWLVLGIVAGLLEFIPVVGPAVSAVPALFFAFTDFAEAPYKPFVVLGIFILIQQIENQLLVPRIMKQALGVSPIIIIIALLVGVKLGGFVGVLLSVPCVAILDVFLQDFMERRQHEENRLEA
ncbi:MAG: AI-2E family transporter [Patescibacteria group bacterium]|jgi:predicted PurR-regulated permease PerM